MLASAHSRRTVSSFKASLTTVTWPLLLDVRHQPSQFLRDDAQNGKSRGRRFPYERHGQGARRAPGAKQEDALAPRIRARVAQRVQRLRPSEL